MIIVCYNCYSQRGEDEHSPVEVEISPLVSYAGEVGVKALQNAGAV